MKRFLTILAALSALALVAFSADPASAGRGGHFGGHIGGHVGHFGGHWGGRGLAYHGGWNRGHWRGHNWAYSGHRGWYGRHWRGYAWGWGLPSVYVGTGYRRCYSPTYGWVPCRRYGYVY